MTRLLYFGDVHLGVANMHDDITAVLDQLVGLSSAADIVLCGGDVFHSSRPSEKELNTFFELVYEFTRGGKPFVILVGNHDRTRFRHALSPLQTLETKLGGVHVIDTPTTLDQLGVNIIAIPWVYGQPPPLVRPDNNQPTVLIAHATVWGPNPKVKWSSEGIERPMGAEFELQLDDLIAVADIVLLSHIHEQMILNESPPVIYPGGITQFTWGEMGPKAAVLAEVGGGYELVPLKTVPRVRLEQRVESSEQALRFLESVAWDKETRYRVDFTVTGYGRLDLPGTSLWADGCRELTITQKVTKFGTPRLELPEGEILNPTAVLQEYYTLLGETFPTDLWEEIYEHN